MRYTDETEADTRADRIDPVLRDAGWGVVDGSRIRREVICPGRIQVGGKRASPLSCDYVLFYKGQKLATLEAKRAGLSHREGVGQAKEYAERLQARFAYASNGLEWREIDMVTGKEADFETPFPSPDDLWNRTFSEANAWRDRFGAVPFETDGGKWEPRYYQHNAINAALEAIAKGQDRILLTLATGTGKTSIAFQIAWKLFGAKWNITREPTRRPRILFLADRNILANQAFNSFSAFQNDAVTRIDPDAIRKKGGVPRNASVFFTIFQTFMAGDEPNFLGYEPDFFDLIIIDECHRGGAKDESEWRRILEYFEPATQLGLTATPKRKHNADTYGYFGEPVYTYALKEGIEDGFLTPFKVRQMASTIDEYVYTGDDEVVKGEVEIGQKFTEENFNRQIELPQREKSRVEEFFRQINPRHKTLVFCATQAHAALVRDYINEIKPFPEAAYCCRVTADDGKLGEQHLRDFQDNDKTIPTILTTSQKLSTGVDARNVRNIVLMRPVKSMIEFKQIIGRGTRVYDGKDFFTIYDFVKAYEHFQDPEWDGEPLEPVAPTPRPETPPGGPEEEPPGGDDEGEDEDGPAEKVVIKLPDGKARNIQYIASTSYWFQGRPVSAKEFMELLFGDLASLVEDEDDLREKWSNPETRDHVMTALEEKGYDRDKLDDMKRLVDAPDSDIFDVLAYVRFSLEPRTRHDRAEVARADGLVEHAEEMREFLETVLSAYERDGSRELSISKISDFLKVRFGTVGEGKAALGGDLGAIRQAFVGMQRHLYRE